MEQKDSPSGLDMLRETVRRLEKFGPETPTVVDLKRLLVERASKKKRGERISSGFQSPTPSK